MYTKIGSPFGNLLLVRTAAGLAEIRFLAGRDRHEPEPHWRKDRDAFRQEIDQLEAYFAGDLRQFDLRLAPAGTAFQQRVWRQLQQIPYGETISYGQLAGQIGQPKAARAVGAANGRNPIPIIIPCHRVIGSDGQLTGYGGGLEIKDTLLAHERRHTRIPA